MSVLILWWSKVLQTSIYSLDMIMFMPRRLLCLHSFKVMHFPHDGKIVTIDQLYFVTPNHRITPSNQTTLNVPHVLVALFPSSQLLPIIGKMGGMDPVSRYHTRVKSLASYVRGKPTNLWTSCCLRTFSEHSSHPVSSSLKNEIGTREHSSFSMSSSSKNETDVVRKVPILCQSC